MSAIVILLIASISVAAIFLAAFIWSVRNGQFDDEFSPPQRMLFENPPAAKNTDEKTITL
jgi:cbb3-type cytochrome oxidase maturation protein